MKSKVAFIIGLVVGLILARIGSAQIPPAQGWYEIPGTSIDAVCACTHGFTAICGFEGCTGITNDWNTAALDTTRNRLIVSGGGHGGYWGNELYALSLTTLTMTRLNDPGTLETSPPDCRVSTQSGTQPSAKHQYDGMEYIPGRDILFLYGGVNSYVVDGDCYAIPPGYRKDLWWYHFSGGLAGTWERITYSGDQLETASETTMAYDAARDKIWMFYIDLPAGGNYLASYDFATNTWTRHDASYIYGYPGHANGVLDTTRKRFYVIGDGWQKYYDVSVTTDYAPHDIGSSGDSGAIVGSLYPGMDYDPVRDRIVAWRPTDSTQGNTVWQLNLDTAVWSSVTYSGGPTMNLNGVHGRFRYVPGLDVFVVYTNTGSNGFTLRLTPATLTPEQDFAARCAAAGVLVCEGFDSLSFSGTYVAPPSGNQISIDSVNKVSGGGSLKFTVPAQAPANTSGEYQQPMTQDFGQNSTFFVQYRLRLDPAMADSVSGALGWKTSIFHPIGSTCGATELTMDNQFYYGFPIMYTDCGSTPLYSADGVDGPLLQQGDYNCYYNLKPAGCGLFHYNEWMTFYYKIHIGTWGTPTSTIEAWMGYSGQPLKQFVQQLGWSLNHDAAPYDIYNEVSLLPYNTGRDGTAINPASAMWFDELIISTQPIAAPGSSTPQAPSYLRTLRLIR